MEDNKQIFTIRQIGSVRTNEGYSTIFVLPEFESLLDGIDSFSHILVLFWPHLLPEKKRQLKKVHPRGKKEIPKQGIFATRSPARPNPVLVTVAKLIKRQGSLLVVQGLDCLDQTPVIDIKPVTQPFDTPDDFKVPDWVKKLHEDKNT